MDSLAILIGSSWIFMGLLCIGLAIPLRQGLIRRNCMYGVRFPQSFKSDEAWFAINRYGATRLIIWAAPMIVAGVVAFFLPLKSHQEFSMVFGFGPLIFPLIAVIQSWGFARRF